MEGSFLEEVLDLSSDRLLDDGDEINDDEVFRSCRRRGECEKYVWIISQRKEIGNIGQR